MPQITDHEFLAAIFRDNAEFAHVTQFPDPPDDIAADRRGICWGGRWIRDAGEFPRPGHNSYFTISIFNPDPETGRAVRRKDNFLATYVIVADDVGEKLPQERVERLPPPSYKLTTSFNHRLGVASEQWGWILSVPETDRARVDNLLDGLVKLGLAPDGKDPGMRGVTRYVRTPGGWNTKASKLDNGQPFKCQLTEWNPDRQYSMEKLAGVFGVDLTAKRKDSAAYADGGAWDSDAPVMQLIEAGELEILNDKGDGRYDIVCPWVGNHTEGDTSGTELRMKEDGSGGFKCHHGSCEGHTFVDFLKELKVDAAHDAWRKQKFGKDAPGTKQSAAEIFKDVHPPSAGAPHAAAQPPGPAPSMAQDPDPAIEPAAPEDEDIRVWISQLGSLQMSQMHPVALQLAEAFPYANPLQRDVAAKDLRAQFMDAGTVKIFKEAIARAYGIVRRKQLAAQAQMAQLERAKAGGQTEYKALSAQPMEINYPFPSQSDNPLAPAITHADNLKAMCKHHNIHIRYNIMTHGIEINVPHLTLLSDEADNLALSYLSDIARSSCMSAEGLKEKVLQVAAENSYHPVLEWLDTVPAWDGRDYIAELCGLLETPTPDLLYTYMSNWMRQGIVAVRGTYGQAPPRNVLVFTGEQYVGKTSFFRALTPPVKSGFAEGLHLNPTDRDSLKKAVISFIVELGELDATFRKADIAALKAHISLGKDKFRLPYAATESEWERRTIYCATVNDFEFLVDTTGNSRWNVVEVNSIDLDRLRMMQDAGLIAAAWKQAEAEIDMGRKWYFSRDEVLELEKHLDQFRRVSAVEEALEDLFDWAAPEDQWADMASHRIAEMLGISSLHRYRISEVSKEIRQFMKSRGLPAPKDNRFRLDDGRRVRGFRMPPRKFNSGVQPPEPPGKRQNSKSEAPLSFL